MITERTQSTPPPMTATLRLGVDLGGTKTEAAVVRFKGEHPPDVLSRVRLPTERDLGYEHILDTVAAAIAQATREAGLRDAPAIGVGMPGSVTTNDHGAQVVKNSNTTCLNGRPFRADLSRRLGRPVRFANDANCFALAEAVCGAARGSALSFGVILGTGVGGGVVLGRALTGGPARIWDGAQGIAGEWGHVSLYPDDGPPCYCGRRGCVEQLLSGPALAAAYHAAGGEALELPQIAARAERGEALAQETLQRAAAHFGRALSLLVNILDPEVIVLGGGVSNLPMFYERGVDELRRWVFSDGLRTRVVRHELGDSAGVLGAAYLADPAE